MTNYRFFTSGDKESVTLTEIVIPSVFKFLRTPSRYKTLYGGRGGGKSVAAHLTLLIMGTERPIRVVCGREIQKSIKDSVHTLLSDMIRKYNLTWFYEIQETVIKGRNGTEFKFRGLKHNITDIKSLEGVDYFCIEEAENVSNNSYEILLPTIRKENSEIWIIFNTKNITDPTYQRFIAKQDPDNLVKKVSYRDNPFFPLVLDKERLKLLKDDPEAYQHIWEGEPDTRRSGAIYAKQIAKAREEGRITTVPYDPAFEVFTAWDLGYGKGNATSIWWLQFVGRELRWLEYYEREGEFIPHFAQVIKAKPYQYMKQGHFLPHDGAAGNVRGAAVPQQLRQLGIESTTLDKASSEEVISLQRGMLSSILEYSVFDLKKTEEGIFGLENYHFEWDEDRSRFKNKPHHDWSSNPADAARYAACAIEKVKGGLSKGKPVSMIVSSSSGSWMSN